MTVKIKKGRTLIRQLATRFHRVGRVSRAWDGRNATRHLVPAGVYKITVIVVDRAHNRAARSITLTVKR